MYPQMRSGLTSSLFSNSIPLKLSRQSQPTRHHLRQFIRPHAALSGDTESFTQHFFLHMLPKTLNSLWRIKSAEFPFNAHHKWNKYLVKVWIRTCQPLCETDCIGGAVTNRLGIDTGEHHLAHMWSKKIPVFNILTTFTGTHRLCRCSTESVNF